METLSGLIPQDRIDADALARVGLVMIPPADAVDGDQIAMRSLMIGVPA